MSASNHSANFRGRRYVPVPNVDVLSHTKSVFGDEHWIVIIEGRQYGVSRRRGQPVRIAFKPRGQNRGYHWYGMVRESTGTMLHNARVFKSTGYLGILHDAGIIRWQFEVE